MNSTRAPSLFDRFAGRLAIPYARRHFGETQPVGFRWSKDDKWIELTASIGDERVEEIPTDTLDGMRKQRTLPIVLYLGCGERELSRTPTLNGQVLIGEEIWSISEIRVGATSAEITLVWSQRLQDHAPQIRR